jgi:hypothetical protein
MEMAWIVGDTLYSLLLVMVIPFSFLWYFQLWQNSNPKKKVHWFSAHMDIAWISVLATVLGLAFQWFSFLVICSNAINVELAEGETVAKTADTVTTRLCLTDGSYFKWRLCYSIVAAVPIIFVIRRDVLAPRSPRYPAQQKDEKSDGSAVARGFGYAIFYSAIVMRIPDFIRAFNKLMQAPILAFVCSVWAKLTVPSDTAVNPEKDCMTLSYFLHLCSVAAFIIEMRILNAVVAFALTCMSIEGTSRVSFFYQFQLFFYMSWYLNVGNDKVGNYWT